MCMMERQPYIFNYLNMKLSKSILVENFILKANSIILLEAETYTPPESVAKEAQQAIDAKEKHGDKVKGGTQVGWTRARQLANKENISIDTIKRMVSFFARHEGNQKTNNKDFPWSDNGYTAWKIWGGDAGKAWANKIAKQYDKEQEKLDEITLPELRDQDKYLSALTKKYKGIRKDVQGQGVKNTKFIESELIKKTGSVIFRFLAEATEENDKKMDKGLSKKAYDFSSGKLVDNPSHLYEIQIQVDNIFPNDFYKDISWLEVFEGDITVANLKEIFDVADIKLSSNDASFQYQGFNYRLTQIDGAIYPENRPDKVWGPRHGNNAYLTKHLAQVVDRGSFEIFFNQMVSSLRKKLKDSGYIK